MAGEQHREQGLVLVSLFVIVSCQIYWNSNCWRNLEQLENFSEETAAIASRFGLKNNARCLKTATYSYMNLDLHSTPFSLDVF